MEKIFKIETYIYDKNILENAVADFSENFEINIEKNELKISGDSQDEINEIFNELMNYYIGLFNQ